MSDLIRPGPEESAGPPRTRPGGVVAPVLDPADYADDMAGFEMTEEQEREFLETLWAIMRSFAEMGFTVDVCGQLFGEFNDAAEAGVDLERSTKTEMPSVQAGNESAP